MCPFVDSADLEQFVTEIVGRRLREQLANNVLRTDVPPRSLPVSKLTPSGTADHVIVSDGETAAWAAVPATGGTPAASAITVTESGIIIPAITNVQQAMRAIEFQAEQLRQQLASHHHDERYVEHPPLGTPDGSTITSDISQTGGVGWKQGPGSYVASMYAANSGAPTHTVDGGWQKVGSGGGTLTWTSEIDKRPSGVSAQVDTATNKRIDIRATGLYRVEYCVTFNSLAAGSSYGVAAYLNGGRACSVHGTVGTTGFIQIPGSRILSLTSGQWLELYAYHDDSASETYWVTESGGCYLQAEYLGPAS